MLTTSECVYFANYFLADGKASAKQTDTLAIGGYRGVDVAERHASQSLYYMYR